MRENTRMKKSVGVSTVSAYALRAGFGRIRGASVVAAGVMIGLGVVAGAGCEKKEVAGVGTTATAARPPAPVQVAEAITRDVPVYLDEIGTCTAVETVAVRPQVAVLDQATASLSQAKANLDLARRQLANAQGAIEAHAISQEELQNRQNAVTVAQAQIRVRQADIEAARVNLDYCTINSPIDGRAGRRLVDVGNVVKANDDNPLVVIQRMDPIYADFTIPEQRLAEVRRNAAEGALKTLVRLPEDAEDEAREGKLTFLDNSVQDGTGTIKLRATLPNGERHFWPGQFCQVRLVLAVKKDAVLIPAVAQQVGQQGAYVYVAKEGAGKDGKPATVAELRPIVPGQRQGELIVVNKGVEPGEKVVTVGQMMIMPGGPVQVVQPAALQKKAGEAAEKKSESAAAR